MFQLSSMARIRGFARGLATRYVINPLGDAILCVSSVTRKLLAPNLKAAIKAVDANKLVICLCLVFSAFVTLPDQSLELYRLVAQSLAKSYYSRFESYQGVVESLILIAGSVLLSIAYVMLAALLNAHYQQGHAGTTAWNSNNFTFGIIACIPCLSVAAGLMRATIVVDAEGLESALLLGMKASLLREGLPYAPNQI